MVERKERFRVLFFFFLLMMLCKINEHRKYLLALHHAGLQKDYSHCNLATIFKIRGYPKRILPSLQIKQLREAYKAEQELCITKPHAQERCCVLEAAPSSGVWAGSGAGGPLPQDSARASTPKGN